MAHALGIRCFSGGCGKHPGQLEKEQGVLKDIELKLLLGQASISQPFGHPR
jgi:hypothetical protein